MKPPDEELSPLHRLILAYAKPADRPRYALLFAIDVRLAEIIRSTSEPLIGQMRLTWWRDILTKPPEERQTGEPLIEAVNHLESAGIAKEALLTLLDGWEVMLDDFPWDDRLFSQYAQGRGAGFFGFAIGEPANLSADQLAWAQAWALWDFARHCSDAAMREAAFGKCRELCRQAGEPKFDRNGRPLAIFCKLVARDVKKGRLSDDIYRPSTAAKIVWHGITGL